MNFFFIELQRRNALLYLMGWILMLTFFIGLFMSIADNRMINGFSVWNTPLKYTLSTSITFWTFGWILEYLRSKSTIRIFSRLIAFSLTAEIVLLFYRALRMEESYFPAPFSKDHSLYYLMLIMVAIYCVTFIFITIAFFRQKKMPISQHYTWGIRMSLLSFLIIILSGALMLLKHSHNFGGTDSDTGIILLNFSTHIGDMRVAHFMALHALQIIPLLSYYLFSKKNQVMAFSAFYMILMLTFMIMAMLGMPLIKIK